MANRRWKTAWCTVQWWPSRELPGLEEQWAMADILIKKHEVREEWVATGETRHVPVATGETRHVPVAKRPKIGSPSSSSGTAPKAEEDDLSDDPSPSPSPLWSVHVSDATAEAVAARLCAAEADSDEEPPKRMP